MQKGRVLALVTAASVIMGAFGVKAWTSSLDSGSSNLPILLKYGAVYMTKETVNTAVQALPDGTGKGLYILQFTGRVQEANKATLVRLGVEMGDYLPENAFLVRMNSSLLNQVKALVFVKGVAAYTPAMKIAPELSTMAASSTTKVRISGFGTGTKSTINAMATVGVQAESVGAGLLTAQVDSQRLQQLAASSDIVYIEPMRQNQLFNDKAAAVMGATAGWSAGLDGKGQIVAITDTGLDNGKTDSTLHPDFQGQVKALYALGKPGDASDTIAHGTHVAGSVLGTGAASNGQYKGMAPGAKLVFEAVEDAQGGLGGIPQDLTQLFQQGYDAGARIHTNSWGVPASSGGTVYDGQSAAVDRFMWSHPDYTILFAAGNDGDYDRDGKTNYGTVSTPGTAKNAITIGASQNNRPDRNMGTNINGMATFSSRGPTGDNRVKPDLVAPGTWIASTRSSLAKDSEFWAPHESNNKYGYMGGTSMATPLTAGVVAQLRQYYTDKAAITPRASLLKATLINGAAAMDSTLTWKDTGWGRVDLNNSLYGHPFKYVNEERALQTGDEQAYAYTVKSGQPLKVTLVWTDYPAAASASKTLVNDLDLTVKAPDGTVITGNHMLASGADHTNNVENVVIATPQDGTYTVTVKGYNVPQGPQPFSVVVSGGVDGSQPPSPPPGGGDTQAPTVSLTSPANGATVSGSVKIAAQASDNVGVSKVVISVDGQSVGTATTAPYEVTWNTAAVANGEHTLQASAYDAAGNVGTATAVKVQVNNQATAGPQTFTFTGQTGAYGTVKRFVIDAQAATKVTAQLTLRSAASVKLTALDSAGRQLATGTTSLSFTTTTAGTYSLQVTSIAGLSDYGLAVSFTPATGVTTTTKSGLVSATGQRYQIYAVTVGRTSSFNAAVRFDSTQADLDLYLVDAAGRTLAQALSPTLNPETVSAVLSPGTYYLYVMADSGQSSYQLTLLYPQ